MSAQRLDADLRSEIMALYNPALGQNQRTTCPSCSPSRKRINQGQKVLSLKEDAGLLLYACHHCGLEGGIRMREERVAYMEPRRLAVVEPPPKPQRSLDVEPLTEAALAYLLSRGVSEATAKAAGVGSRTLRFRTDEGASELREVLVFPYTAGGQQYAQKVRTFPDKKFTQIGSAATLWLGEQVHGGEDLIIAEGELDALSIREAGHRSVVSVPNGAPLKVAEHMPNAADDRKFQYIWAGADLFKNAKRVIIAGDNDPQGQALAEEIARRWGRARTWRLVYPADCKDANDVLIKHGPQKLKEIVDNPEPWPVDGVYDAMHYAEKVRALFAGGLGRGADPGMGLGDLYTLCPGHVSVITGIPGSGKSSVFNQIMVNMAKAEGWTMAVYSSETPPEIHIPVFAQMYLGKPFFQGPQPRMNEDDLEHAMRWVNDHFLFLHSPDGTNVESLIERLEAAVMRMGIRAFIIDPANYLQRSGDGDDVEWVGKMLERFRNFAQSHDCHGFIVAHPKKMEPGRIPTGYDISGCYDDQTEVLTTKGWVPHPQVTVDHEVMCFDPMTEAMFYAKPSHVHIYDHDGPMHHYTGRGYDLMVTPNHRMVVKAAWALPKGTRPTTRSRGWGFLKSEELTEARWAVPMGGEFLSPMVNTTLTLGGEVYPALPTWWYIGFWTAEGHVASGGLSSCQVEEKASLPIGVLAEMGVEASDVVRQYRAHEKPLWINRIKARKHPALTSFVKEEVGEGCANKRVPKILFSLSREEKEAYLQGLLFGDGSLCRSVNRLTTTSRQLADDVQRLAMEVGMTAHVATRLGDKAHHRQQWIVSIRPAKDKSIVPTRHRREVGYNGKVYCLTVPTGAYVTRRNGKVAVCGNSAHWYNRADFGVTIHRPEDNRAITEFHVWKVRWSWTGKEGKAELFYDIPTGRFSDQPFGGGVIYSMYTPPDKYVSVDEPWEETK